MRIPLTSPDGRTRIEVEVDGVEPEEFEQIAAVLAQNLAQRGPAYVAVSQAMTFALNLCPNANPADLWVHVIYNLYCNRMGLPAQSWKRVGGQAFEHLLIGIYGPRLAAHEIIMRTSVRADAEALGLVERGLGSSKTDIILEGNHEGRIHRFGVIHTKTSIAERLTDDAPASVALIGQGYWSAVATLDNKQFPPPHGDGIVRGEFGPAGGDKRRYFEVAGQFSSCYSFNLRTPPSRDEPVPVSRIYSLPLNAVQPDVLVRDVLAAWNTFRARLAQPR